MRRFTLPAPMDSCQVEFEGKFRTLKTRLSEAGMEDALRNIPELKNLRFEVSKVFRVGGLAFKYPFVIHIGEWGGDHWACPDGKVFQEQLGAYGSSVYWTAEMMNDYAPPRPAPFNVSAALEAGLITPMTPETLALVRFYIVRQANKTNQKTRRLDFPNFDNLMAALREVSTPMATATSGVVSDPVVRATSGSVMQSATEDIRPPAVSSNPSVPPAKRQRGHGHRRDRSLSEPLSQPGIGSRWEDLPAMAETGQMDPTSSVPKRRRTRSRSPIPERDLGNEQTSGLQELIKGPNDRRPSLLSHREAPDTVAGEVFDLNVSQRSQNSPPHEPGCSAPEVPNMIPLGPSLAEQLFPSDESEDGQVQRDSATVSEFREDSQAIPTWADQTNFPGGSREDADQEEECQFP
jgi:hypothetical protein